MGRTLYSKDDDGNLRFEILRNDSMATIMGGTSGMNVSFDPVKLWIDDSTPNQSNVSAYVALTGETVNISDAYEERGLISAAQNLMMPRLATIQNHF